MKKRNLLSTGVQRISRNELRKIVGGNQNKCGCSSQFLSQEGGTACGFFGPGGQICTGTIVNGQCCVPFVLT